MEFEDNTQKIYVRTGPCGSGKTYATIQEMVATPGYYIMALEKHDLIFEMKADIERISKEQRRNINIIPIASNFQRDGNADNRGTSRNCRADIEALPSRVASDACDHVIALVTHVSLLSVDPERFSKWHLVIDEIPSVLTIEQMNTEASLSFFEDNFSLTPSKQSGWSTVALKSNLTRSQLGRDYLMSSMLLFYDRVEKDGVENNTAGVACNVTDWKATIENNVSWTWWSIWNVSQLRSFASVTMLGNNFQNSVFAKLVRINNPNVEFIEKPTALRCEFAPRLMQINYFTSSHRASAGFFKTEMGLEHLGRIGDYVRENVDLDHIWTANSKIASSLGAMPGKRLKPRQAGSNLYAGISNATMIYTAKASPAQISVFEALGVDPETFSQENELETIVQFCARLSVRDPASSAPIVINLYDEIQALHVAAYFRSTGYVEVETKAIDLGFMNYRRLIGKPGPKVKELTPAEAETLAIAKREIGRLRTQACRARKKLQGK